MKPQILSTLVSTLIAGMVLCVASETEAQDRKADPTGTWSWAFTLPNGNSINQRMTLKLDGDKLTGVTTGRGGNEVPLEEPRLKGTEISFQVTRDRDGDKVVVKYNGKISGDRITGKIESNFGGEPQTRDWEAKREVNPAASKMNITGNWKYTLTTSGGQTFEPILKLKQDGDKLSGVVNLGSNEVPISDGTIKENEVSFKVERERDAQTLTIRYNGKLDGEIIKGKIRTSWGGNDRTYDFEAKRSKD